MNLLFQLAYIFLIHTSTYGATLQEAPTPFLADLLKNTQLLDGQIGYRLVDISDQKNVESFNGDKSFIPASITKVLTIYYALSVLGPNYQFLTLLKHDGKVENGVLKGNLYLIGRGEPMLTNAKLMNMVLALKDYGIQSIEGKFFYDDTDLNSLERIADLGLIDQTYNPGISALSAEFNRFKVWREGPYNKTKTNEFTPIPDVDFLEINKYSGSFGPGTKFRPTEGTLAAQTESWDLSTHLPYYQVEELPVRNPSPFTASIFKMLAQKEGIILPRARPGTFKSGTTIFIQKGLPVSRLAELAMEYSNNLITELLMLKASKILSAKTLSLKESSEEMLKWLKLHLPKLDWGEVQLVNGSGLTINNRLTANFLSSFLQSVESTRFGSFFYKSFFAISGQSGWLIKRLNSPDTTFRVWGKTGSLDYVNNLCGYLYTNSGKHMSFSIFTGDLGKRLFLQQENSEKVNKIRSEARKWDHQMDKVIDGLLTHWIKVY